jgi:DNA-directed RNA polymerase sigma subunit (sigma70/sigma32)
VRGKKIVYGKIVTDPRIKREREKEFLALHNAGRTLGQIGKQYGLSKERVRQVLFIAKGGRPYS